MASRIDPELRAIAHVLPRGLGKMPVQVPTDVDSLVPSQRAIGEVTVEHLAVLGCDGGSAVAVLIYRSPDAAAADSPALLWMHGGGYVSGAAHADDSVCAEIARALGMVVVSVDYRLAPLYPFPAALDDIYTVLRWMNAEASAIGLDPTRIAIGGESAGGGLAAQLAIRAHDEGELTPVFQLLVYPMLDDRTVSRTDLDESDQRMWDNRSNAYGWSSYLGEAPGGPSVPPLAAPARREDLSGLPPAWIGVGDLDLFLDEDVEYARRLSAAGVPCELDVVQGAFHGFHRVAPQTSIAARFRAAQLQALQRALFPTP